MELTRALISAWWGKTFVAELSRTSGQTSKKIKVRRGSLAESAGPGVATIPSTLATPSSSSEYSEEEAGKGTNGVVTS